MSRKSVKPARPRLARLSAYGSIKSVFVSKKAYIFTEGIYKEELTSQDRHDLYYWWVLWGKNHKDTYKTITKS